MTLESLLYGIPVGATIAGILRLLGVPFPWEWRIHQYSTGERVKEIKKARKEINIVTTKEELKIMEHQKEFSDVIADATVRVLR